MKGNDGQASNWAALHVEAGLLERSDWRAKPVTCEAQASDAPKRPFRTRKSFDLSPFVQARLYVSALGAYEAYVNGQRVGADILSPGWTSYHTRLNYQTYDVTGLLLDGKNVLGAWVGEGWYAGRLGYHGGFRNLWGERPALIAQLEVDGRIVACTGEEGWEWSYGALITSEIYNGEVYDISQPDDFEHGVWQPVDKLETPTSHLIASQSPQVKIVDTISPKDIFTTPLGKTIVDFGQNFAGVIRILGEPPKESIEIILKHAEVMENGELGTRPLRHAKASDRILLGGNRSIKGYLPKFTFHGFRYAEVTGWPGLEASDLEGVVFQTAMESTGDFSCSHSLINRLHENCVWSTIANTISVPTDCPQRDERLGWTGDICVYAPTMSYLFDTSGFLSEWLRDVEADQERLDGVVPIFVPDTGTDKSTPEAIWGDVSVITPNDLDMAYDDPAILATQFNSMRSWLDKGISRDVETGLWDRSKDQLGDWLAPRADPATPNMGPTDNFLVADAWLIYSTKTAAAIARKIGKEKEAKKYETDALDLTEAFYHEYVSSTGRLVSDTQTALCLLLKYHIFPPRRNGFIRDYRSIFSKRLVELVRKANWQVDTGFAGTPIILQTLAENGHLQDAYRMLQAKDCPSWLSPVLLGATSIWERWDSMLSDGSINPGEMTSFNHYALGSVASFMHSVIGGLNSLSPGWKEILIRPQPGGTITSAKTSHVSPYGRIACEWELTEGGELVVWTEVPPNCSALVVLPGLEERVGSGKREYKVKYQQPDFPPNLYVPHFAPIRPANWVP